MTEKMMAKSVAVLNVAPAPEKVATGLKDADRRIIAETLSELTVQTYRVLLRSQVVHWNVAGPLFHPIHVLTEEHYNDLFVAIDALAERIRALGFPAPTGKASLGLDKALSLGPKPTARNMVGELIDDHEGLVRMIREGAEQAEERKDFVTHDLLAARLAFHEKAIWMLRAIVAE